MRVLSVCLIVLLSAAGGCSWIGRTAGKAQAKMERKADALEDGYKKGYKEEKAGERSAPAAKPKQSSGGAPAAENPVSDI